LLIAFLLSIIWSQSYQGGVEQNLQKKLTSIIILLLAGQS
jgi:hypothetical protein